MTNTREARACPDLLQYQQLATGKLPEGTREALLNHLETCDSCAQKLRSLPEPDTLVGMLRQADTLSDAESRQIIAQLVERLSKLRPQQPPTSDRVNVPAPSRPCEVTTDQQPAAPANPPTFDFLAPAQQDDEIGQLGGYRILEVLGAGGMGVVFRAEDPKLARLVALKAMLPGYLARASARQRFLREAQAAAAIKHDHIVSIYQVGEDRGVLFLAMELLEGESLDARLQREGKLPAAEVVRIGRQIAQALAAAHKRGLIHRDIKPANIWIEAETSRVKILDFGLARGTADNAQITQQGVIVGTPAYMAPEQGKGKDVDHRCDLFSLGCVLYRMATGAAPFRGTDVVSTLMAVATETPRPPRVLEPSLPGALSDLIVSLLAKEAGDRPASAQVVVEKLDESAQELSRPAPARPRKRWPAVAAAAAFLAAVAAGVVFFMQTADGTVRIEIDDPQIKLAIEGHAATITNADKQPIKLKPGKHGLTITRGDFSFNTASFELPRRGKTVLKVTWHPGQKIVVMQDGTAIGEKAAPLAATGSLPKGLTDEEWLEHVKGLYFRRVPDAVAGRLRELNPGFDGKLEYELDGKDVVKLSFLTTNVKDIAPLRALPRLRNLACGGRWPVFGQIRDLKPLEGMKLTSLDILDTRVANLSPLEGMPLTDLVCAGTKVADLSPLEGMPLKNLRIDSTPVTDLSPLKGMKLETLCCFANQVTDLSPLKGMKLRFLDCNAQVTDAGLAPLEEMTSLRDLRIGGPKMTEAGLAHLKKLTDLEQLHILDIRLTEAGLRNLKGMTRLEHLALPNTALPDDALVHLKGLPRLRFLSLVQTRVTDAGLEHLAGLKNLVELHVERTAVTDKGVAKLKAALPACKIIWPGGVIDPKAPGTEAPVSPKDPDLRAATPDITPQPLALKPGEPVSALALVQKPAKLPGLRSWTIETLAHRSYCGLLFRPDGKQFATTCRDGTLRVYDVGSDIPRRILVGHNHGYFDATWSPDGKYLASAGGDRTLRIWDSQSGRLLRTIAGAGSLGTLAWSPDGNSVACISWATKEVCLWSAADGKGLKSLPMPQGSPTSLAWSRDGKRLAGSFPGKVTFWDTARGEAVQTLLGDRPEQPFAKIRLSPDGQRLAAIGGRDVYVWDLATSKKLAKLEHPGGFWLAAFAWSPDSRQILSWEWAGKRRFWDVGTGKVLREISGEFYYGTIALDGKTVLCGGVGRAVTVQDFETGKLIGKVLPEAHAVQSASWSPPGDRIALGIGDMPILDSASGRLLRRLDTSRFGHWSAAWSPTGKLLATGFGAQPVQFWNPDTGENLSSLDGQADALAWSHDGRLFATGGNDKIVRIWNAGGKQLHALASHAAGISSLAWSVDGTLASGSRDGGIRLWDATAGKSKRVLQEQGDAVTSLAWSPDGKSLASLGARGSLSWWDPRDGNARHKATLPSPGALAWSPDGKTLAADGREVIRFFDGTSAKPLREWSLSCQTVPLLAFSAKRNSLLTTLGHGVQVLDVPTGQRRGVLLGLPEGHCVVISCDGHWRGTPGVEKQLIYIAVTDAGQELLTYEEFSKKYGWKNEPDKVRLLGAPRAEEPPR